jgi:type VI secretion system secreted protein Hcp
MAVDMFLKLDGIAGESQDSKHKDEIDVLAWSWGASNSGTTHMGSGGGAGKANFQDLSFTKYVDKASPPLLTAVSKGTHIKTATLVLRKAGGTPVEYYKLALTEILISSVSTGGSGGEDRLTENVTLNFASFALDYIGQDAKGGALPAVSSSYNIAANAAK